MVQRPLSRLAPPLVLGSRGGEEEHRYSSLSISASAPNLLQKRLNFRSYPSERGRNGAGRLMRQRDELLVRWRVSQREEGGGSRAEMRKL